MMMPFQVLGMWLRGLLSIALLGLGIYLLVEWYNHRRVWVEPVSVVREPAQRDATQPANAKAETPAVPPGGNIVDREPGRYVAWEFGLNRATAYLLGGLALVGWSLGGGWLLNPRLLRRRGNDEPSDALMGTVQRVRLADGGSLRVVSVGPPEGDPIIFTHGWGLDSNEWYYTKKALSARHRVITWDLPGLGESDRPADRDWSLEKLAHALNAVVQVAGEKPVVLAGHSIGVMITLTYCRLFHASLGSRVQGLVLAHGTYTNPVRTMSNAGLYTALQKPVLEPLCHLMVVLSPLVRVMNWMSFLNGSAHRSTEKDSFSGNETRGQLDFITHYYCAAPPDVAGRGMLAMFRYDATDVLARIPIPTLIVTGDGDKTCLPEASSHMEKTIPDATLVTLSPARHCGLFEHHGEFHKAVENFLARLSSWSAPERSSVSPPTVAHSDT